MVISFHLSNIFSLTLRFYFISFFHSFFSPSPPPTFHQLPDCMSDIFGVRWAEGLTLPSSTVLIPVLSLPHLAEKQCLQSGS